MSLFVLSSRGGSGNGLSDTFETVSKNLKAYPYTLTYISEVLSTIEYTTPGGDIVKTFGYSGDQLITVTLSGSTPSGISLVKTFTYIGDAISEVVYS